MLLLIDNYDSFTYNLARYLRRLLVEVRVLRNDHADLMDAARQAQAIVLSPGPCGPVQAGKCISIVQELSGVRPILGICLGHQVICHAFGGKVVRAAKPVHGQAFAMEFIQPSPLFEGIPNQTRFARYHSLIAERVSLPSCLSITATCETKASEEASAVQEIMAVEHSTHLTFGVQFHPESILSEAGYRLLANFLNLSGWHVHEPLPQSDLTDSHLATLDSKEIAEPDEPHTAVLPQY